MKKHLKKAMFDIRFLFYGIIFGMLMSLFGISGIWGAIILAVFVPVIFWMDNKYMKPLKERL